jgi:hypothetical protein
MASSHGNRMSGMLGDYAHLRTLPAMLSVVYILAGLYQGGLLSRPYHSGLPSPVCTGLAPLKHGVSVSPRSPENRNRTGTQPHPHAVGRF